MQVVTTHTLTHTELIKCLEYDHETGNFLRKWSPKPRYIGKRVGSPTGYAEISRRYLFISVGGETHPAHRLAWFYVFGEWPRHEIDHLDRNPQNNRIGNLRDVPHHLNPRGLGRKV